MIRIVIIGAGNVASQFYSLFSKNKATEVIQVYNRNRDHLHFVKDKLMITDDLHSIKEADLYFIAVADEAITGVVEKIKDSGGLYTHCSGTQDISALSKFKNHGVLYPLQSISKNATINFKNVPFCLEANSAENLNFLSSLAEDLSEKVFEVNSRQRRSLHAAAVFVNNFSNHLYSLAADYCQQKELPFEILLPLIKETVAKLDTMSPYSAQTGPAVRNDASTIEKHLELLDDDMKEIYKVLTRSIQDLHGKKL